jgi:hypothetical protein
MATIDQSMITIVVTEEQLQEMRETGTVQIASSTRKGTLQITLRMIAPEQEAQEQELFHRNPSSKKKRHSSAESESPSKKRRSNVTVSPPAALSVTSDDESTTTGSFVVEPSPRTKNTWTPDETKAVIQGVERFGVGKWRAIEDWAGHRLKGRTNVNIHDKWRTIEAQRTRQEIS